MVIEALCYGNEGQSSAVSCHIPLPLPTDATEPSQQARTDPSIVGQHRPVMSA